MAFLITADNENNFSGILQNPECKRAAGLQYTDTWMEDLSDHMTRLSIIFWQWSRASQSKERKVEHFSYFLRTAWQVLIPHTAKEIVVKINTDFELLGSKVTWILEILWNLDDGCIYNQIHNSQSNTESPTVSFIFANFTPEPQHINSIKQLQQ